MKRHQTSTPTPLAKFVSQHKKILKILGTLVGLYVLIGLIIGGVFLYWFVTTWNKQNESFQKRWNESIQQSNLKYEANNKARDERSEEFQGKRRQFNEDMDKNHAKFKKHFDSLSKHRTEDTEAVIERQKKLRKIREKLGFKGFEDDEVLLQNYDKIMALPDKPQEEPQKSPTREEVLAREKKKREADFQKALKKYGYVAEDKAS